MSYIAPVKDMLFCMRELAALEKIAQMPGLEEAGLETVRKARCNGFSTDRSLRGSCKRG